MSRKKVLISHPMSTNIMDRIRRIHDADCISSYTDKYQETYDRVKGYDALFAINILVDAKMIDRGTDLKLISNYAVGYDNIDVAHAKANQIVVANIPDSTSRATAEYAMALILDLLRKITLNDRMIKENQLTDWSTTDHYGHSPADKTLGILGLGRIGKILARQAQVFGMHVIYHNRNQIITALEKDLNVRYVTLKELFNTSDVLSINTPLTPQTHHIVNHDKLSLMKPSAYLVNTGRGDLIDHSALISALTNQQIAGAALDVFPDEPVVPDALKSMDNVILSPHNGTGTHEDRMAMWEESWGNIVAFFNNQKMTGRVV